MADSKDGNPVAEQESGALAPHAQGKRVCRESVVAFEPACLDPLAQQQRPDRKGFRHVHWPCCVSSRRRSARAITQPANATSKQTTQRNNAASALTSGLTPRRTLEKTAIGKVVADGPVTKLAITKSSSDSGSFVLNAIVARQRSQPLIFSPRKLAADRFKGFRPD
jgi:hypothetical protein